MEIAVTAMQVRQMGRIMKMELEKTESSATSVSRVSSGTSTSPPPAPNNPANEIYTTGKDLFDSLPVEKKPFVIATPVSGSYEFSKVEKNTLTFSTPIPAGSLTARVLIEFNYLDQLISLYEDQNLFAGGENWGTTSILGGNTITFERDISTFRMDLVG